jgi:FHS family L-fucose permease-like MFS transporter
MRAAAFTEKRFYIPLAFVTSLFMLWGIALSISDVLNKHFQEVLHLSKSQSGLIQFSVFGAYFLMSVPAGIFMKRFGYKPGVLLGLLLFGSGAFLFIPAANNASFTLFRIALFIIGCGMATLETVAHPFMAALGDNRSSDRRINFAQAFNAVGTMIGPALGTYFLLSVDSGSDDLHSVKTLYGVIGLVIIGIGLGFSFIKVPVLNDPHAPVTGLQEGAGFMTVFRRLFSMNHFRWAVAAQFCNVAAQAGTWAFFINYAHEKMGFNHGQAGTFMVVFMGMMALGRIVGTALMKFIAPKKILAAFALANIVMCIIVSLGAGWISFTALLMINFFFGIMFPTIFSLGLKGLGTYTEQGSSFIAMGVVGGAFFPLFMGYLANRDVGLAYLLPIICYVVIFLFAAYFNSAGKRER